MVTNDKSMVRIQSSNTSRILIMGIRPPNKVLTTNLLLAHTKSRWSIGAISGNQGLYCDTLSTKFFEYTTTYNRM